MNHLSSAEMNEVLRCRITSNSVYDPKSAEIIARKKLPTIGMSVNPLLKYWKGVPKAINGQIPFFTVPMPQIVYLYFLLLTVFNN